MIPSKLIILVVLVVGALIALSAWTQVWFVFSITEGVALSDVSVAGTESRPLVSALALGALAAVAALLLAGRFVRTLILLTTAAIGLVGLASVFSSIGNPVGSALGSLSSVMGVVDISTIAQSITRSHLTPWPWVTAFGFSVVVIGAVLGIFSARRWSRPARRFTRPEITTNSAEVREGEMADGDSWDSLSRGEDPTS